MKSIKQFEDFISRQEWVYAKTYSSFAPHEYVVKNTLTWRDKKLFEEFVLFIRKYGYKKMFRKTQYICFDIGKYRYWTQGDTLENTIILNRATNGYVMGRLF